MLIGRIALGHPDPRAPVNRLRPARLPRGEFMRWHGFEAGA